MAVMALRVWTFFTLVASVLVYVIHRAPPYLRLECVSLSISCPIAKSYGTINDASLPLYSLDSTIDLKLSNRLKNTMQKWVRDGYSTAAQLSIFIDGQEKLNIFTKDDQKYPKFDRNSLVPVPSITGNFAAMLMVIAVQNKWIRSLDDAVTDYWPKFPTHRLVLPFDTWLAYYDAHSSSKSNINHNTLAQYCNQRGIHMDIKRYHATIKDVLRHEAGYGLFLSHAKINRFINGRKATYQDIKYMMEASEYLIQFEETPRSHHVFTGRFILNQIFMEIEPKHRSMADYYQQEIVPKLSSQNIETDQEFVLLFDGLEKKENVYPMKQPPIYWYLYHVTLPLYLGRKEPLNDVFQNELCPTLIMDKSLCSNASLSPVKWTKTRSNKMPQRPPYLGDVGISLVSNAYSIAKTVSHILFSGEVIEQDMLSDMVSESVQQLDMYLGFRTTFSKGGFAYASYHGVDWYGWPGFGGSVLYFAPKHKCVVSFIVTASTLPHYNLFDAPRHKTIMNLVSLQLLQDDVTHST